MEQQSSGRGPSRDASPASSRPSAGPASRWVIAGLVFYAAMAGLAWLWRGYFWGEPLFFLSVSQAAEGLAWGPDLVLGLAAGGVVLVLSGAATRFTGFGQRLADRMGEMLAGLSLWQALILAVASAVGEELFFRGALQPRVGWMAASLLFGLMHIGPGRDFLPWTVFAILVGGLLGLLFIASGNLLAPIVAHAVVNGVNLPLLSRRSDFRPEAGPWAANDPQGREGGNPSA